MPTEENLTIEKLVYGGEGLARLDGKVVLVPFVAPGEQIRAEVERVKNDLFRGRVIDVVAPAAERVAAPCPYFLRCGGCQLQHLNYGTQVQQKIAMLREALRRVGKIEFDGEIEAVTGEPWGYRNRIQLHVDRGEIGYFEYGSRRLCAVESCPIASPGLNRGIAALNAHAARLRSFSGGVELFTNETEIQVSVLDRASRDAFSVFESIGTSAPIEYLGFRVSRNSFFQVNRFLVEKLVECAVREHAGDLALDLYAGAGLFSRALADKFGRVTAIESGRSAHRDLVHNLGERVESVNATVEEYLEKLEGRPDFILADPPRAGLGKQVVSQLTRGQAPTLVIVSCDPATLSRDLQGLIAGGYRIEAITLVDLFPQTFHLETVVRLQR